MMIEDGIMEPVEPESVELESLPQVSSGGGGLPPPVDDELEYDAYYLHLKTLAPDDQYCHYIVNIRGDRILINLGPGEFPEGTCKSEQFAIERGKSYNLDVDTWEGCTYTIKTKELFSDGYVCD